MTVPIHWLSDSPFARHDDGRLVSLLERICPYDESYSGPGNGSGLDLQLDKAKENREASTPYLCERWRNMLIVGCEAILFGRKARWIIVQ